MKTVFSHGLLPALVIAGLNACGGGAAALLAGGGISGTGLGTITLFGSVIINDIREFAIDANTQILWDGNVITEQELMIRSTGPGGPADVNVVASVDIGTDVSPDFTSGTAVAIRVDNMIKGPVTSLNPLQVLGQDVVLTADTNYFENDAPSANYPLALNDAIEINGFADNNNINIVSRIERKTLGLPVWKLVGIASAPLTTGDFNVGSQEVSLGSVVPDNCTGGVVSPGDFVEVKAAEDPLFNPGAILTTVTAVECRTPGLAIPANASGTVLEAQVEGLVTSVIPLVVNGQTVTTGPGTVYTGGSALDVIIGAKLEAEGDLDTTTGILAANQIRLRGRQVRIEAPAALPLGASFPILENITINTSSLTEDDDGLIGAGNGNRQVEVLGFLDANDQVIATRVRDRGPADPGQVRLRGPVGSNTCDPTGIGDRDFDILTVTVDTSTAGSFAGIDGTSLSEQAFCDQATTGNFVEVEDGVFLSGPARIESADQIEIED